MAWLFTAVGLVSEAAPAERVFVVLRAEPQVRGDGREAAPSALSQGAAAARRAEEQRVLAAWVEGVGGRVLQTYSLLNHAAFVEVPRTALEALKGLAEVQAVVPERHHSRSLDTSVGTVRAGEAWRLVPGRTGRGIRIGIIDSGIDYLHADFGGPGRAADHEANDPTRIEPGTFPTGKVVGGVDLVGDAYDSSSSSSATPTPDPDPLDPSENGHGTHVAGIAAGYGVLADGTRYVGDYGAGVETNRWRVAPGVAPEASLYAIKVFGSGGLTSSRVVVDALNRAADPNGDGDTSDRLDVVNLSLGTVYGEEDPFDPEISAVGRLAGLGCVVVLSAGNGGNAIFKIDSPAVAPAAIAVANSYDKGYATGALRVEAPGGVAGLVSAVEANFTPPLAGMEPVRARVVLAVPALACDPLQNGAALAGRIAMVDRGVCFFVDKVRALQSAGAVGVIVVNNVDGPPEVMGGIGDVSALRIPALMISKADGAMLKPLLDSGAGVEVTLSSAVRIPYPELGDTLAESSSRGVVWPTLRLKPDLSAPGSGIDSAKAGSGSLPVSETGTSMSAPHVAGAAALVRQARPGWRVSDLKAALMNTSRTPLRATNGAAYPESRMGAGRLDVAAALGTDVVAYGSADPNSVSLSFGAVLATNRVERMQQVTVANLGTNDVELRVTSTNTLDQPGVRLRPDRGTVVVRAGERVPFGVVLEVDPEQLAPDADGASSPLALGRRRQGFPEASGQLWLVGGGQAVHVPWHCAPRAVTGLEPSAVRVGIPFQDPQVVPVPSVGRSVHGRPLVGFFLRGYVETPAGLVEPRSWTDIIAAGAASDHASVQDIAKTRLHFAAVMAGGWPAPTRSRMDLDVEIDRDSNGTVDVVLSNGNSGSVQAGDLESVGQGNDGLVTVATTTGSGTLVMTSDWNGVASNEDAAAYLNGVVVHSATGAELGLSGARTAFRYRVVTRGAFADQTPWIRYEAAQQVVDGTPHGLGRGPWQLADATARVVVRRSAAVASGFQLNGRIPLLCVYLHGMPGNQARTVELDLSHSDADGDGWADVVELEHLHDLAGTQDTDRDGDGQSDGAEVRAGTDPLDPDSLLRLWVGGGPGLPLEWAGAPGRVYSLLRSRAVGGPYEEWRTGIPAAGLNREEGAMPGAGEEAWYYRLRVD